MSGASVERPTLERWLMDQTDGFPKRGGLSYPKRLQAVSEYLGNEIHPQVEKGALLHDDGFLTDHGPQHIDTVIRRAGDLLSYPEDGYPHLKAYEVYILLMAIHFHDVGNLYGRREHEQKLEPIMDRLGVLMGEDMVERQTIRRIAQAHGGRVNGGRDTISRLPIEDHILDCQVRYRTLAAILRLADELADDSGRTNRTLEALKVIPPESQAFHMYAQALQTVAIEPGNGVIKLRFFLTRERTGLIGKGGDEVYLLDEIYARTVKMHYEREYCTRFTRGLVDLDAIDVRIEVYEGENSLALCGEPIEYWLQSSGYPGGEGVKIQDLLPTKAPKSGAELYRELEHHGEKRIDGAEGQHT